MNLKVDQYIQKAKQWASETEVLRAILLKADLQEDIKWGKPCYSFNGKNVAIIQGFKGYFALLLFNGYLLSDPKKLLQKMGENTNVGRQMRFENVEQIKAMEETILAYIEEAKQIDSSKVKSADKPQKPVAIVEEFKTKLEEDPRLADAFSALTPGRQKAYLFYFSQAKQAKTREARVEKCIPKILNHKGLDD